MVDRASNPFKPSIKLNEFVTETIATKLKINKKYLLVFKSNKNFELISSIPGKKLKQINADIEIAKNLTSGSIGLKTSSINVIKINGEQTNKIIKIKFIEKPIEIKKREIINIKPPILGTFDS